MELLFIFALILLNGIFSMTEMALVSSRKFKLENAKKKGSLGAKAALKISEHPTKFLSTVQIGMTLTGILLGVYSGENITNDVTVFIEKIKLLTFFAHEISVGIVVIFITYLTIVLGELFPKRLGLAFPEKIAIFLSRPMIFLSKITSPFIFLLTISSDFLLTIFSIKKTADNKVSEEEIKSIIKESADGGEIQDIEQNIVERVFELGDRKVNSLLTHRSDIIFFDLNDNWESIRNKINKEKHSAYPVCKNNNIDNTIGIVLLKDLFTFEIEKDFNISKFIKQPLYLNETTYAYKVLELFKNEKMHYGIVVDEYGITQGIVTMDDVVDALVGDATEIDQDEYQITERSEGNWFVDGQYSVLKFIKYFDLNIDYKVNDKFTTVAGLIINEKKSLPNIGDKIVIDNYELEIIDKDGQRIDKILVTKINNN